MLAKTTVYPNAGATVLFNAFGDEISVSGVYSITTLEQKTYLNSIYYPFHYELTETEITVTEQTPQTKIYYQTEVD